MSLSPPRRLLFLAPVLFGGLVALGASVGPVSSTETRYSQMAREMLETGDFVVPLFNGAPLLEKPPFEYWATASSLAVLGVNDVAPRVPHLLGGALVVFLAAVVAWRFAPEGAAGRWRGGLAAVALATMPSFLVQAYTIAPDVFLLAAFTAAGWALLEADRAAGRVPRRWALLLHGALGVGMLVKGPLALGLVLGAAGATALLRRDARILRPFANPLGLLVFAAVTVPWYVAVDRRIPGLLSDFVTRRLFGGLGSSADFHSHPVWYVWLPILGAFPWIGALPGAVRGLVRTGRWRRGPGLPAALLALSAPLLFTFSASRLTSYASPAYPWIAILVALGVETGGEGRLGDASAPRGVAHGAIGMALVAALVPVAAAIWTDAPPLALVASAAFGLAALACVFVPRPLVLGGAIVVRAALASVCLVAAAGAVAAGDPTSAGSARGVPEAYLRHRVPGEPIAVALNYNGDWGILPWTLRAEVPFFGYPSPPMMVAPEKYRPDLFRPREDLGPWLRAEGRRWLMVRPRVRKRLVAEGVTLHVVATAREYELVATVPPAEPVRAPPGTDDR